MHDFDFDAERIKLERLLSVDEGALAFLSGTHSSELRYLREDLSACLYRRHQDNYARLARLSRVLPSGASAKLAETVLGSVLGAGVAGEMDADRVAKLVGKLSPKFLAKLSIHLEPQRATGIIKVVPEDVIIAIAKQLVEREEFITLARFVTAIEPQVLNRVMDNIDDDVALLRVGIFVEQRHRLDELLEQLSQQRREAVLRAATQTGLWPQTLVLMTHLSDRMKGLMGDAAVAMGEAQLEQVIETSRAHNLWEPLVMTLAHMHEDNRRQVLSMPMLQDAQTVASMLQEMDAEHMWALLAKIWLDAPQQTLCAAFNVIVTHDDWLADLLRETHAAGREQQLRTVIERLPPELQQQLRQASQQRSADDYAAVMG